MATSTLYQTSPLGSPAGSPRFCHFVPRPTFQPRADWRASFTNTNKDTCRESAPKPLILRQHNGVWLSTLSDTTSPNKEPSSQPQPEPQSVVLETAEEKVPTLLKARLSLGRVPKTVRCHMCQAIIKEHYFQNHLFFGVVRCDLCDLHCGDCRSFQRLREDCGTGYNSCPHSFSYSEDPYEYLLARLSGSDDMDVGGSLTLPNKLRVLQHYVNQLTCLHLREPWCTAVRKCKSRLLKYHAVTPSESSGDVELWKDSLKTGGDLPGVEEDAQDSPTSLNEGSGCDASLKTTQEIPTCPSPTRRKSQEEELLTQSYDLEHLEQAVEYVELEEQCKSSTVPGQADVQSKPRKRRKIGHYKKLKSHRVTFPHKKRRPSTAASMEEVEEESDLVKEEIALPENGYYLMVREGLEACPMCYESLSPKHCSVNLRTFLFTVSCSECGLLIFIVPDLPDGLKIVTDSGGGEMITQTKQNKQDKTTRKVRPQDFFAR